MPTAATTTQSAAERRSAEAEVRALIAKHAAAHEKLIASMRRSLRKRLPTAHEVVYEYTSWLVFSFSPSERGYEGVLAIRAAARGVELYLNNGKGLPDPDKLLRGSAKLVRFIPMESAATLRRPAVVRLIDAALARNRVPFARTGRGPVTVRSSSGKKRGGR